MNKNKGIWLVIAAILIVGITVTFATSRFIRRNGGSLDITVAAQTPVTAGGAASQPFPEAESETPASAKGREAAIPPYRMKEKAAEGGEEGEALPEAAAFGRERAGRAAAEAPDTVTAGDGAVASPETAPAAEPGSRADAAAVPSISPLGPDGGAASESDSEEKLAYYEKRLTDLDAQVQKTRSESSDSTTYSMKIMAEKELKLWNIEMNTLYGEIMDALSDDAEKKLEDSQQAWMKTRDTKAEEAAGKYSGGSLEGVEYTASQAESTRDRTYELVESYIDALPAENDG